MIPLTHFIFLLSIFIKSKSHTQWSTDKRKNKLAYTVQMVLDLESSPNREWLSRGFPLSRSPQEKQGWPAAQGRRTHCWGHGAERERKGGHWHWLQTVSHITFCHLESDGPAMQPWAGASKVGPGAARQSVQHCSAWVWGRSSHAPIMDLLTCPWCLDSGHLSLSAASLQALGVSTAIVPQVHTYICTSKTF